MASILIRQFAGQSVPPTSDAILYENATTGNGVIHGCNCTASDASTIHIDAGYGVIQGRFFEIEDQTISVTLAPSGTLLGQLYIHLDLSDADTPIDIYHEEAASLTAMTQQSGINYSNGIYEIQLCTYDVSTSTISNVVDTFPTLVSTATAISTLNSRLDDVTDVSSNITIPAASGTSWGITAKIKNGWFSMIIPYFVPANTGDNQTIATGLPKALCQMQAMVGGANSTQTAIINGAGTGFWINAGTTSLNGHIGANSASLAHWIYIQYQIDES